MNKNYAQVEFNSMLVKFQTSNFLKPQKVGTINLDRDIIYQKNFMYKLILIEKMLIK
jgi:hypothetical protein